MFADQEAPGDVPNILQILNITLMMEQAVEDHDEVFDWDLDGSDE
jgi:hypothetical protein